MDYQQGIHLVHNALHPSNNDCNVIEVSDCEEADIHTVAELKSANNAGRIDYIESVVNAWNEMSEQSRSLSSSFMISQASSLKKRVREVAYQTCTKSQEENSINDSVDVADRRQPPRRKNLMTNSTSTINQGIDLEHEKERLVNRMSQMRRMALIFQSLDRAHLLLRTELDELLEEAQREHIYDMYA